MEMMAEVGVRLHLGMHLQLGILRYKHVNFSFVFDKTQ